MIMRYFCTYFDHNFLPRGLVLYKSLKSSGVAFQLWVLCLSDECHQALRTLALPDVMPIAMSDLERGDDALLAAKANRSRIEYYFTCTPSLPWYILEHHPEVDLIT